MFKAIMQIVLIIAVIMACGIGIPDKAYPSDKFSRWELYGTTEDFNAYFDVNSIERAADGEVRVMTKWTFQKKGVKHLFGNDRKMQKASYVLIGWGTRCEGDDGSFLIEYVNATFNKNGEALRINNLDKPQIYTGITADSGLPFELLVGVCTNKAAKEK